MDKHYLDTEGLEDYTGKLTTKYKTLFASKTDVGTPLVAATAAAMTDTTKIYVYTGSETGYTAGNWYYYNGSAWVSGGIYNSTAFETDTTLSESGMAADAKATGDGLTNLKNAINIESIGLGTSGLYYNLSSTATSVDINTPTGTAENFFCGYAECNPGDYFFIKAKGYSSARCWAFLSSASGNNNIITRETSANSQAGIDKTLVAPDNAKYIVFNSLSPYSIQKYTPLERKIDSLQRAVGDIKTKSGTLIEINDALFGIEPIDISDDALVYSRNMYKFNITTRTTNGITFTQDPDDHNTLTINGTATSNAYSYGSITTSTAENVLEAGDYWVAIYDDYNYNRERPYDLYVNVIDYATGDSLRAEALIFKDIDRIKISQKSYVGLRVRVSSGSSITNKKIKVYFSKVPPLSEYAPYVTPSQNNKLINQNIIVSENSATVEYYGYKFNPDMNGMQIATFNVGEYSGGHIGDVPSTLTDDYLKYIASLNVSLLVTQEDRIYLDTNIKTADVVYPCMYQSGKVASVSVTTLYLTSGNGIYTNKFNVLLGYANFNVQGTHEDRIEYYRSNYCYTFTLINNKTVLIITPHLSPKAWNTDARKAQCQELIDFVASCGVDYAIIAGDFNVWEDEIDAFVDAGYIPANKGIFGTIYTFNPFDKVS